MSPTALLVEPSPALRTELQSIVDAAAGWNVISRATLEDARKDITASAPAMVVTSLKLGSFNGVHLVYLAKLANPLAVCVVYGEPDRADEAQRAGAIYVDVRCITEVLPDILAAMFPRAVTASGPITPPTGRIVHFPEAAKR
jgi:DNA-binding NarL/FixJ family response regulator